MQIIGTLLAVLSKILYALLTVFVGIYLLNFVFVGTAFDGWNIYVWFAHATLITGWYALAYGLGFASKKLRNRKLSNDGYRPSGGM
ncbi:hypothetical protein D3C76_1164830 [compost metagenome]